MVFSQDGIFNRAEQAVDKHGEAKARETLELALGEAQMQKYEEGLTDEQLTEKINAIGEELPKEKPENPNLQNVIVDGHIFEIDRSVPKIVDYIGPANGVIITATINQSGWTNSTASSTVIGTIKTYSGGNITSSTATVVSGNANVTGFPTNGGNYTISNITEDTDIKITATDSNGKSNEKIVNVRPRRDTTAPTLSEIDTTGSVGLTIKFKATATDNESGLKESTPLHYTISQSTGLTTTSGDFNSGVAVEITSTEVNEEYTITIVAEDKAGNQSTPQSKKVKTGIIKHINTTAGLKAINACDIYGATVTGYDCTRTGVEWQIFYIDEEDNHRVYLIAKDYMAPPTTNTELTHNTNSGCPKSYYWNEVALNKYKMTIPNIAFTAKFLSDYVGVDALSQMNLQATNYMLDQSIWQEYMSTNEKSDYAFGGPTLPLFTSSYNDICKKAKRLGVQKRENGTGYEINEGGGNWITGIRCSGDASTQEGIYFKGGDSKSANGAWLASPSTAGAAYVMHTYYDGVVTNNSTYRYNDMGFRPVVSLKPNIQFTDNGNGTYTIN